MSKKENILGINVSNETYDTLKQQLFNRMDENKQSFIVAVNPEKIMKAEQEQGLRDLINSANYQIPDGVGVLLASRLQGGSISNRITGIDLMMELVQAAAEQNKRVCLYGAKPGVAETAKKELQKQYPNLQVTGVIDGYIKDNNQIVDTINESQAEILFVAMGSPRQEEWIRENQSKLNVSVFQGVGGSFDVLAGNIKRAPGIFRRFGLEWLYRLIAEPWRFKRQMALPRFLVKVIKSKK